MLLSTTLLSLAHAADRPPGDRDKSMYTGIALMRVQAEPAETLPLSTGFTLGAAVHPRSIVGATLSLHSDEDERGTTLGYRFIDVEPGYELWKLRPELFAELALVGAPAQGWLASAGVGWLGMTSWPGGTDTTGDLDLEAVYGPESRGGLVEARVGTGYRWTFHPGAVFHLETGLRVRTVAVGVPKSSELAPVVPYLQVASGWAIARGPAPRPGYRSRAVTGKVKPETVIGIVVAALAGTAITATAAQAWDAHRGYVED